MNDNGDKCGICLDNVNLPIILTCNHKFCFLCIKGTVQFNNQDPYRNEDEQDTCPLCRAPIDPDLIHNQHLKTKITFNNNSNNNNIENTTNSKNTMVCWLYESLGGGWWMYDMKSSQEIEEYYGEYRKSVVEAAEQENAKLENSTEEEDDNSTNNTALTSNEVEIKNKCDIIIGAHSYQINFESMTQKLKGKTRRIKRLDDIEFISNKVNTSEVIPQPTLFEIRRHRIKGIAGILFKLGSAFE